MQDMSSNSYQKPTNLSSKTRHQKSNIIVISKFNIVQVNELCLLRSGLCTPLIGTNGIADVARDVNNSIDVNTGLNLLYV